MPHRLRTPAWGLTANASAATRYPVSNGTSGVEEVGEEVGGVAVSAGHGIATTESTRPDGSHCATTAASTTSASATNTPEPRS